MRRLALFLLVVAAIIDVSQQAYSSDLIGSISNRAPGQNWLAVIAHSPVVTTLEHWGLFLLGFGALSLAMSLRKPGGPDVIG